MKKIIILSLCTTLTTISMGAMNVNAAPSMKDATFIGQPKYCHFGRQILSWTPAGNYSHDYVIGKDITNGKEVIGSCVVTRYREVYNLVCLDCGLVLGPNVDYPESHGSCPL